jgi:(1->4)-alpha-D-glucan 1-alpha-D-glucosylmutase
VVPGEFVARLSAYMHKAIKEAKRHTSWITPHVEYEDAVARFVERTLTGRTSAAFRDAFAAFVAPIATAGMVNALAQLVLKVGSPGVADFYQGTEFWDQSLVDPDNRRPVDFVRRAEALAALEPLLSNQAETDLAAACAEMMSSWPDGRIKLYLTARGIRMRRERPALFTHGSYTPLKLGGAAAEHLIAFERRHGRDSLVTIAPRLTRHLGVDAAGLPCGPAAWTDTFVEMPGDAHAFRNLITSATLSGGKAAAAEILRLIPVAWLVPV